MVVGFEVVWCPVEVGIMRARVGAAWLDPTRQTALVLSYIPLQGPVLLALMSQHWTLPICTDDGQ